MSGLFGTFNVAKRGLFAQQKAIDVTTHNIANANTEGYSRQRAIMETTRPFSMPSINNAIGPGQLGTGVEISIIQRVRDEFLDYQVRTENSTMGMYEARDKFLSEIESVFNEPSDTGISTMIGKFFDSWQGLSTQAETSNARTVVAQQANAFSNDLNHSYNQLQKIRGNTQMVIKDTVFQVNNVLDQIDSLNQQIMKVKVSGQEPNDLMDKRDLLVDKLSKEFNIKIDKKNFNANDISPEDIGNVPEGGETLLIRKEPNYAVSRFSYINGVKETITTPTPITPTTKCSGALKISYLKNGDSNKPGDEITIEFKDLDKGQIRELKRHIDECRVMWSQEDGKTYANSTINFADIQGTGGNSVDFAKLDKKLGLFKPSNGSLEGYMSVQEDVDRYEDQLNKLAKAIAFSVNAVHSGLSSASGNDTTTGLQAQDNMPFFVNNDTVEYTSNDKIGNLGVVLSSEAEINAGNISINKNILSDVMQIKTRTHDDQYATADKNDLDGETDGKRALAIAQLRNTLIKIQDINLDTTNRENFMAKSTTGFNSDPKLGINTIQGDVNGMTIDSYFKDTVDTVGIQEDQARTIVKNQEKLLGDFEQRRTSVSGVSLDEEMANLIQFQHAYGSNAKIISTVDELLDVVVNGLKR